MSVANPSGGMMGQSVHSPLRNIVPTGGMNPGGPMQQGVGSGGPNQFVPPVGGGINPPGGPVQGVSGGMNPGGPVQFVPPTGGMNPGGPVQGVGSGINPGGPVQGVGGNLPIGRLGGGPTGGMK